MISVFTFPDGSALVNKVWSPSVSLSSLYRINNKIFLVKPEEFSRNRERQVANAVGCYTLDVATGAIDVV